MSIDKQKADFDKWTDQWEKALEQGVFNDAPHVAPPTTPQTAEVSYFGPVHANSSDEVRDVDAKYWQTVYAMSGDLGSVPDPLRAADNLIQEERKAAELQRQMLNEAAEQTIVNAVKSIAQSPNPVRHGTVGKDQDLTPQSLSQTFSEEDIEKLTELKIQLYNAQSILVAYETEGKSTKAQESKIADLREKVDALSDAMTQIFPLAPDSQGD
jgi:hypothetical protein